MLAGDERDWLNAYHAQVRAAVAPGLSDEDRAWLERATRPL
jgi:Xaa-Pro aminopeptidase